MDALAQGLRNAARMIEDGILDRITEERYATWKSTELGQNIEKGVASLADCERFVMENGEPELVSGKQEMVETIFNRYMG